MQNKTHPTQNKEEARRLVMKAIMLSAAASYMSSFQEVEIEQAIKVIRDTFLDKGPSEKELDDTVDNFLAALRDPYCDEAKFLVDNWK